jgi:hypothetical protein
MKAWNETFYFFTFFLFMPYMILVLSFSIWSVFLDNLNIAKADCESI